MRRVVGLLLLVGAGVGCALPEVPPGEDDNEAPIARLQGPQIARVGVAARYDASASDDVDGEVVAVAFAFSDGSGLVQGDADGVFDHVFAAPGRFSVRAEVEDDDGALTPVDLETVVVVGEVEPCTCEAPCLDAGVCTAGGCVVLASSADEALDAPGDAVDCDGR